MENLLLKDEKAQQAAVNGASDKILISYLKVHRSELDPPSMVKKELEVYLLAKALGYITVTNF